MGFDFSDGRGAEAEALLGELAELVSNLGMESAGAVAAKVRNYNPAFVAGAGKCAEIIAAAESARAGAIIFDDELTPAQQRNWEEKSGMEIVTRQEVILDIFASRARTKEARLQVELAKLEYSLPRLRKAWSHLDRQRGGGVTQRGGGESQLELDRRGVRERIARLKTELARVRTVRATQRKRRERAPFPTAAIVGYTNAGKSSLINCLSDSSLLSEDKLFATLDPATRRVDLPGGSPLLLTDTVGFVRKLPHRFVEAFKATLEEAALSDFLVHVIDVSNPDAPEHARTTLGVLKELGADEKRTLTVFNKIDIAPDGAWRYALSLDFPDAVEVSARTGRGIGELVARLEGAVGETSAFMRLFIPHSQYAQLALLHSLASVASQKYADGGVEVEARIPAKYSERFREWELQKNLDFLQYCKQKLTCYGQKNIHKEHSRHRSFPRFRGERSGKGSRRKK
ncbi:MAG: GTPase HflX [Verrucomicrobia bacterium CAG:312_58_20]|nr:MAG: GTPase HflX [Verrucomicrobia bacterium CAG:312_58_20]